MMCQAKREIGLNRADVYVSVRFVDNAVNPLSYDNANYSVEPKHHLLICAQTPLSSATGVYSSLIGGHWIQERADVQIQTLFTDPPPVQGDEALPEGANWNWCV
jgi:hypothetical protein